MGVLFQLVGKKTCNYDCWASIHQNKFLGREKIRGDEPDSDSGRKTLLCLTVTPASV